MSTNLKCQYCNRPVKETVHSRKLSQGYRVDYYLVWTGTLNPITMKNPRDEREVMQFYKMEQAHPLVACQECFSKPEVQKEMDHAFRQVPEPSAPQMKGNEE